MFLGSVLQILKYSERYFYQIWKAEEKKPLFSGSTNGHWGVKNRVHMFFPSGFWETCWRSSMTFLWYAAIINFFPLVCQWQPPWSLHLQPYIHCVNNWFPVFKPFCLRKTGTAFLMSFPVNTIFTQPSSTRMASATCSLPVNVFYHAICSVKDPFSRPSSLCTVFEHFQHSAVFQGVTCVPGLLSNII